MLEWLEWTVDEGRQDEGDHEHLELLWEAYEAATASNPRGVGQGRRDFAERSLTSLSQPGSRHKIKQTLLDLVSAISAHLGIGGNQFVVNLILFNYRTANGGRIRRATELLRRGFGSENDEYLRPFETDPPGYVADLLRAITARTPDLVGSSPVIVLPSLADEVYIPPTRFTASFPLVLGSDPVLKNPTLSGSPYAGPTVSYRFLGSFGFAEPAYCYWTENSRSESGGTRLSLGAYALNATYLEHLRSMLGALRGDTRRLYAQYGSVGAEHVEALYEKFGPGAETGWSEGASFAVRTTVQLAKIARATLAAARAKTPGMASFFDFVTRKLNEYSADLDFIWETRGAYPSGKQVNDRNRHLTAQNVFDRIWVIEAALWEFTFLGATRLPMSELHAVLASVCRAWTPSIGVGSSSAHGFNDSTLEQLSLGELGVVFDRLLFPSGTSAANQVHRLLVDLGYQPHAVRVDRKELSTFTPYFEFYQQVHSLLSPEEVASLKMKRPVGGQFWLNLSDGLHASLLRTPGTEVGATLARMAASFFESVRRRVPDAPSPVFFVIDYTKWASNMPNSRVYPILAQMARWLTALLGESEVAGVLFLRSNLKYNTGSLDRYQLGEVLVWRHNLVPISDGLSGRISVAFEGDSRSAGEWILGGEYVSMARKVYLLNDAVVSAQWEEYAKLWGSGTSKATMSGPKIAHDQLLKVRSALLSFLDSPLAPIFTNLIRDARGRSAFARALKPDTRTRISTLWERLRKDAQALSAVRTTADPELELRIHTIAGYLEHSLDQIIGAMASDLGDIPRHEREAKQACGAYLSRLKAARSKLSLRSDLAKVPGATDSVLPHLSPRPPSFSSLVTGRPQEPGQAALVDDEGSTGKGRDAELPIGKAPAKGVGVDGSTALTPGGPEQERVMRLPCLAQVRNTCGQRAAFNALALDASGGNLADACRRMRDNQRLHNFADMPVDVHDDQVRTMLDEHGGQDIPILGDIRRLALLYQDPTCIADSGEFALYGFLLGKRRRLAVVINTHALTDSTDPHNLPALSSVSHYFAAELSYADSGELVVAFADSLPNAAASRAVVEGILHFFS